MWEVWEGDEYITSTHNWDVAMRYAEAGYTVIDVEGLK